MILGKFGQKGPEEDVLVFLCIPVSPGNSRLITITPRHLWVNVTYCKWWNHMLQNLIIDSDLYLLRVQEEKLLEAGPLNWQKVCFVPAKADANVVLFRKWLKKYSGGQFDWGTKFNGALPHIPPREQFFDRYWSHVVNCSSCNRAYKGFKALKISLQVFSVSSVAIMAATKPEMISVAARNTLEVAAIMCFVGSLWLSRFIYRTFHFHDYNHAFK
ncbi:putative pheophorbide a oxygenase [Helianthus debilis subsp. tardiflorus]